MGGLCRGHSGSQRRHLGHRAGGTQPYAAAPDHQRGGGGTRRFRGGESPGQPGDPGRGSAGGFIAAAFSQESALLVGAAALLGGLAGSFFNFCSAPGHRPSTPALPAKKRPSAIHTTPAVHRPNTCAAGAGWITTWSTSWPRCPGRW